MNEAIQNELDQIAKRLSEISDLVHQSNKGKERADIDSVFFAVCYSQNKTADGVEAKVQGMATGDRLVTATMIHNLAERA